MIMMIMMIMIVYSYIINDVHTIQWLGETINGLFMANNFCYKIYIQLHIIVLHI